MSIAGRSVSALIGCTGLPPASFGICGFIIAQISLETVMALPLRSIENGVMMCALVPKPIVAAIGWPASMWAPSSSPVMTRSSSTFQLACASSVTIQALVLEVAVLLGDRERRHVGELDEAELQLVLLGLERGGARAAGRHGERGGRGAGGQEGAAVEPKRGCASVCLEGLTAIEAERARSDRLASSWTARSFASEVTPSLFSPAKRKAHVREAPDAGVSIRMMGFKGRLQWRQHSYSSFMPNPKNDKILDNSKP